MKKKSPAEFEAVSIPNSLESLRTCLKGATQTPVIDDVIALINKQLDKVALSLMVNDEYLTNIIRTWEKNTWFSTRHNVIGIENVRPFLVFHLDLKTHVEHRAIKDIRTPYLGETKNKTLSSSIELLNARFPQYPFENKHTTWARVGSECQAICTACEGSKAFICKDCSGKGVVDIWCPKCGGSGVMDKTRTVTGTDITKLSKMGTPGNHVPINVSTFQEEVQCTRCIGNRRIRVNCARCSGTGKIICKDCKGIGTQYYRQIVESSVHFNKIDYVVPPTVPHKWVKAVKASERVIVRDYLPGTINAQDQECYVHLQHVGITVIPAVAAKVVADGQRGEIIVLNNNVFSKSRGFGRSLTKLAIMLSLALVLVGLLLTLLVSKTDLVDWIFQEVQEQVEAPLDEPLPEAIEQDTAKVEKTVVPKKSKKRRKKKKKKKKVPAKEIENPYVSPVTPTPTSAFIDNI